MKAEKAEVLEGFKGVLGTLSGVAKAWSKERRGVLGGDSGAFLKVLPSRSSSSLASLPPWFGTTLDSSAPTPVHRSEDSSYVGLIGHHYTMICQRM